MYSKYSIEFLLSKQPPPNHSTGSHRHFTLWEKCVEYATKATKSGLSHWYKNTTCWRKCHDDTVLMTRNNGIASLSIFLPMEWLYSPAMPFCEILVAILKEVICSVKPEIMGLCHPSGSLTEIFYPYENLRNRKTNSLIVNLCFITWR